MAGPFADGPAYLKINYPVMPVEVFKTNVKQKLQSRELLKALADCHPNGSIHFDLEDCDKILRVEAAEINPLMIVQLMNTKGYLCEVLQ